MAYPRPLRKARPDLLVSTWAATWWASQSYNPRRFSFERVHRARRKLKFDSTSKTRFWEWVVGAMPVRIAVRSWDPMYEYIRVHEHRGQSLASIVKIAPGALLAYSIFVTRLSNVRHFFHIFEPIATWFVVFSRFNRTPIRSKASLSDRFVFVSMT